MKDSYVIAYCYGSIEPPFHLSIVRLMAYDFMNRGKGKPLMIGMIPLAGLYIAQNRNAIVRKFLATPAEWLLFIDTDMNFPADVGERLIASATENQVKILSAFYVGRPSSDAPGELYPVWFETLPDDAPTETSTATKIQMDGIQELSGGAGMGCCLIHREVLESMRTKYEGDGWTWFAYDMARHQHQMEPGGEDLSFCKRAAAAGYPTYGDARIQVEHFKPCLLGIKDFMEADAKRK